MYNIQTNIYVSIHFLIFGINYEMYNIIIHVQVCNSGENFNMFLLHSRLATTIFMIKIITNFVLINEVTLIGSLYIK